MRNALATSLLAGFGIIAIVSLRSPQDDPSWTREFHLEPDELTTTGRNPYFILEPGYQLVLADGEDQLIITVTNQTRRVGEVETRVVEERESEDGELAEVSRNYFAISKRTNAVFYFGEEVDIYRDGKITSHEGAWSAGVNGARFGLMIPGLPLLGARYYQEIAPGVAMDRAEILSISASVTTPAGTFRRVLRTAESTPLEPGRPELKVYAPGVGLLQDGSFELVSYGKVAWDE